MPFGRDTPVVPSNFVLDRGPGLPMGRGDLGIRVPSLQQCRLLPYYFGHCYVFVERHTLLLFKTRAGERLIFLVASIA